MSEEFSETTMRVFHKTPIIKKSGLTLPQSPGGLGEKHQESKLIASGIKRFLNRKLETA